MRADSRLQAHGWLPGTITHSGDELSVGPSGMQGNAPPIACQSETLADHAESFHLKPFQGAVDVTNCAAGAGLLTQDVPRLESGAQFNLDVALSKIADPGKPKFKMRCEPSLLKGITC